MMMCRYHDVYHDTEVHTSMEVNSVNSTLLRGPTLRSCSTGGKSMGRVEMVQVVWKTWESANHTHMQHTYSHTSE